MVPAEVGTVGAKAPEGVGGRVEERGHDHVVRAAELGQQPGQRLLVGRDDGRRLLDVEVQDDAGELLEHLAQRGDAERRGRPAPGPGRGSRPSGRPGVTSAPGIHQYEKSISRSSASVKDAMVPCAAVVRSTVASWQTTSSPSAVAWTSSSIPVAPASSACAMACRVDEGDSQAPP